METIKDETRIMGEKSIAKTYKGILRIAHILDLVRDEEDVLFNPTYYSKPKALMNISGGAFESPETGFHNPIKGMDGTISRYSSEVKNDDELLTHRVPMTDSMGNFLNWNIGLDGVTIGSNEEINSSSIELESFKQTDIINKNNISDRPIWQEKYFPVLESGEIIIGLQNKEYPSNKYKVNKESGLILQQKSAIAKLIVENKYDKSNRKVFETPTKNFAQYLPNENNYKFRTIYQDNKSNVEEYDVFMYRQDDWDCENFDYTNKVIKQDDKEHRGNAKVLSNYEIKDAIAYPISKTLDCNVGITNLKEYVFDKIQKYMNNAIIEVPTGTIINQYCSIEKWYAPNETGTGDKIKEKSSYPGHRPSMMGKRIVGGSTSENDDTFIESTIMGASKKINRLINPKEKPKATNEETEENTDINYKTEGYYTEIIPLYKRDYVLCDGSIYAIYLYPTNFDTENYPNRRDSLDRFLDLFFTIGYTYTVNPEYVNTRFENEWSKDHNAYKIVRANATFEDRQNNEHFVTAENCMKLAQDNIQKGMGIPQKLASPQKLNEDRHAIFVEDFLTILAFDEIYKKYSQASHVDFEWTNTNICNWLKTVKLPEKYILSSFLGYSNNDILNKLDATALPAGENVWIDRTENAQREYEEGEEHLDVKSLAKNNKFVMDLPYYNFTNEDVYKDNSYPVIKMGREVKTFNDLVKYWDEHEKTWVIIEAYKLPQIQHFIDLFSHTVSVDTLANILNNYYAYPFQVPNLTKSTPTFMGSSGFSWADSQFNRVRTPETWTSSYSSSNYMHRHAIFVDPNNPNDLHSNINRHDDDTKDEGVKHKDRIKKYSSTTDVLPTSYVLGAAMRGGKVFCNTSPAITKTFDTGHDDNPNYIWNELGAGENKMTNLTIENEIVNANGMRYPIFQFKCNDDRFMGLPTGNNRPVAQIVTKTTTTDPDGTSYDYLFEDKKQTLTLKEFMSDDFQETSEITVNEANGYKFETQTITRDFENYDINKIKDKSFPLPESHLHVVKDEHIEIQTDSDETVKMRLSDEIWNTSKVQLPHSYTTKKMEYENKHYFGWEHYEDPRFETGEPNRGRTSVPVPDNTEYLENSVSYHRYEENKNNWNIATTLNSAEWFSPENIKMLPLIKL